MWSVGCSVRLATGGTAGNRFLALHHVTSGIYLYEQGFQVANTGTLSLVLASPAIYLANGDAIGMTFYTDGGSTQSTEAGGDRVSFRMAWVHD